MTEDTNTQPVADTANDQVKPGSETSGARDTDDLDSLLSEFEQGTKPSEPVKPEPKPGADNDLKALTEQVRGLMTATAQQQARQDMEKAIKAVRGEFDPNVFDDTLVEAWMDAQARTDPRLASAWQNRAANPKQFDRVLQGLGKNFQKKFSSLPDKNATEDREAVTAAVRGASTKVPEGKAPAFGNMSNAEYRKSVKDQFGFDPGV